MNAKITTSSAHGYMVGDAITTTRPDYRIWKRLWHFVTFRNPPIIITYYAISNIYDSSTITVSKND